MHRILVALLLLAPGLALADTAPARRGAYLGLGGSFAVYTDLADDLQKQLVAAGFLADVDQESPLGLNVRAGYRVHPRVGAELEFEWLPEADLDITVFDPPPVTSGTAGVRETFLLSANAKGFLLTGAYQPYLFAGVGYLRTRLSGSGVFPSTDQGLATRFGAGFEIYLTENLMANVSAGYVLPFGAVSDLGYGLVQWGLGWRF